MYEITLLKVNKGYVKEMIEKHQKPSIIIQRANIALHTCAYVNAAQHNCKLGREIKISKQPTNPITITTNQYGAIGLLFVMQLLDLSNY